MNAAYVKENPMKILRLQALWIFDDELAKVSKRSRWLSAHASQPIGKPLHKHAGYVEVKEHESIAFHEKDTTTEFPLAIINDLSVSYDKNFKRMSGGRGLIPPMHFSFDSGIIYFFTRDTTDRTFSGGNRTLRTLISQDH